MGLTSFSSELPSIKDISVAKNYLNENELKVLNNLVSGYFDLAEIKAIEHRPMYMSDYVKQLDSVKISHTKAIEKAKHEYHKYQIATLSPVEKHIWILSKK